MKTLTFPVLIFAPLIKMPPKSQDLGLEIKVEGDPTHAHQYEEVGWNHGRDEKSIVDMDKDDGQPISFPMATFKTLLRCKGCGREAISSSRSLV